MRRMRGTSHRWTSQRLLCSMAGCLRAHFGLSRSGENGTATNWARTGLAHEPTSRSFRSTRCPRIRAMVAVIDVQVLEAYTLRLGFDDGSERVVDLSDVLWGPMGEP